MQKRATSGYVWLGMCIRYLIDAEVGTELAGHGLVLNNVNDLERYLAGSELKVTHRLATQIGLYTLRDEMAAMVAEDEGSQLTVEQRSELMDKMLKVRDTSLAESNTLYAYVVSDKRLDVEKLANDPGALLPPGVFAALSDGARVDFAEGCKCVAFERPTAAAFHFMRATEDALRVFYVTTVRRDRVSPLLWKRMTDQLAKRRFPPPAPLLAQLDHIRVNFRNPTQHPEAVYDIHEAQDLAFVTMDVLSRLIRATPTRD